MTAGWHHSPETRARMSEAHRGLHPTAEARARMSAAQRNTPDSLWLKVDKSPGCWLWTGCVTSAGYGYIAVAGVGWLTHRLAWTLLRGPIPDGLTIDHLCRVKLCVNPNHLEPVTNRENVLRGIGPSAMAARRETCAQGHPYDESNTYRYAPRHGARYCRTCGRLGWRRRHPRKAVAA